MGRSKLQGFPLMQGLKYKNGYTRFRIFECENYRLIAIKFAVSIKIFREWRKMLCI